MHTEYLKRPARCVCDALLSVVAQCCCMIQIVLCVPNCHASVMFVYVCKVARVVPIAGRCTHVKVGTEIFIQLPVLFASPQIIEWRIARALPPDVATGPSHTVVCGRSNLRPVSQMSYSRNTLDIRKLGRLSSVTGQKRKRVD